MITRGALDQHKDMIDKVQDDLKVDQNIEVTLRLAASPRELLSEGSEPLLSLLLKGISLDVKLNVWKKIADVLLKVVENGDLDQALLPIFGGIAPAFLLKVTGSLNIEIDEYMQQKLAENPLLGPAMMDAFTLIMSITSIATDEEFDESLKSSGIPEPLYHLIKLGVDHLGDEIDFSVAHPQLGLKGRLTGDGLGQILYSGCKFIK